MSIAAKRFRFDIAQFPFLFPDDGVFEMALRGAAMYGLSWFDAHLWACAEVNAIDELVSEDFLHGRMYGTVTVRNPFLLHFARARTIPVVSDRLGAWRHSDTRDTSQR